MKKVIAKRRFTLLFLVSFFTFMLSQNEVNGQLKIHSNGVTTINYDAGTTAAKFYSYFSGSGTYGRAIMGNSPAGQNTVNIGLAGYSTSATVVGTGQAYGVFGIAGNASDGWNSGVLGSLYGTQDGAGVYGTTEGNIMEVPGRYAGYFHGNVKITGNAWVNGSTIITSDERAKKEIKAIEKGSVQKLQSLKAIKYKLKTPGELDAAPKTNGKMTQISSVADTATTTNLSPEILASYERERIGLSAQEVKAAYPELVVEDKSGRMGVDYIGLIPVLIEAIKEQQLALEMQQAKIARLEEEVKGKGKIK